MAIHLSNKTDAELKKAISEANLIPKGTICDFEVLSEVTMGTKTIHTEDAKSKAGNEMIVLVLKVFHGEGFKIIIDYLTANNERMEFKLRHAMSSCGIADEVATAESFIGKSGKCKIGIQVSKDPQYSDKNTVADYIEKSVAVELDDSIPSF